MTPDPWSVGRSVQFAEDITELHPHDDGVRVVLASGKEYIIDVT